MNSCVCGEEGGRPFDVSEHYFGLGHEFTYLECDHCGSVRIETIPSSLGAFYPDNYYSFSEAKTGWRVGLQRAAMLFAVSTPWPRLPWIHFSWASVVQSIGISRSDRLLDVGSGAYGMAARLRDVGHRNALGVDPFVSHDIHDRYGLATRKAHLSDIDGEWDLITFNHSLEHVPDPVKELRLAKSFLSREGRIVVRLPLASYAYKEYGRYYYGLDAPRHLFLPTEKGFRELAYRAGLSVSKVTYDSHYMQFFHSENYRQGITLVSAESRYWELITRRERRRLMNRACQLNRINQGDQAIFFLSPA